MNLPVILHKEKRGNRTVCSYYSCRKTAKLTSVNSYPVCPKHVDISDAKIWKKRFKYNQHQQPKGHQPSVPFFRLPILEYEAAPPGGPIISKPIAEVFPLSVLNNKK